MGGGGEGEVGGEVVGTADAGGVIRMGLELDWGWGEVVSRCVDSVASMGWFGG